MAPRYIRPMPRRPLILVAALAILAVLLALPTLAASPSPAPSPNAAASPKAHKEKPEGVPVTLTGTVATSTDADGETSYTLSSGGTTYQLEAGPSWFFGENHPLKPFVGKSVTIVGEKEGDGTEVDVQTVDGTALRAPGKPPWAGGWKRVGKVHPGWSQEKADRFKAKFGDCFPPGQCKTKTKADEPKASTAP